MTRSWDCVRERQRSKDGETAEVWHVAAHRGRTADFCPIRCSTYEGITFPGAIERRSPTCPDCIRLVEFAA